MMKPIQITLLFLFLCIAQICSALNDKYRVMWRADPATTMVIGWNQISGTNPVVHYDQVDHGTTVANYSFNQMPDRTVSSFGMNNHFVRLTGLQPNTAYYFVIVDSEGVSSRMWFKTAPNTPNERLSIIAGGDSRNNRTPRQNANTLVGKLRPHVVLFGGDMTDDDTAAQWIDWMDDWQLSIGTDGRIIPIQVARGNHELNNDSVYELFDSPNGDIYYGLTFGGNLLRSYTLNSLISVIGTQTDWLEADLMATNTIWKMAQYHYPIVPHTTWKLDNIIQEAEWSPLFDQYDVNLAIECDAHMVKSTWPIRVASSGEPGEDKGFVRDDANGTVYVGEGTWGAPLRPNDDDHAWTRNSGSFNGFKWIFVDQQQMKIRTINTDNAASVGIVDDSNIFIPPTNLNIWNPSNGAVICIENPAFTGAPTIELIDPLNTEVFVAPTSITLSAIADDSDGFVKRVDFYIDNAFIGSDDTAPYSVPWNNPSVGTHQVLAEVKDNLDFSATDKISITVLAASNTIGIPVSQSTDDAEENTLGIVQHTSSDLELVNDGFINGDQVVGIRFNGIGIPRGSTVDNAYIQFTSSGTDSGSQAVSIQVENDVNPPTYGEDIEDRPRLISSVIWNSPAWNAAELNGTDQATPNLNNLVQQIVDMAAWVPGNSMGFIFTGNGTREAHSFDGDPNGAAILNIVYSWNNAAPTPPSWPSPQTLCMGDVLLLDAGSGFSQYFWNDNVNTGQGQTFSVTTSGTYRVRVMDQWGQTSEASVTINVVGNPSVNLGPDQSICSTCSATLDAGSGFDYLWSTGETTQMITINTTNTYAVTITDSNGCTATDEVFVLVDNCSNSPEGINVITTMANCFGESNGAINVDITSGTPPYSVQWSNGAMTEDLTGIPAGTYTATITDGVGCLGLISSVVVGEPSLLEVSNVTVVPEVNGGDGMIDITVSGGVAPYTYDWSNGAATEDLTNVPQGTYTVIITDANGCTTMETETITLVGNNDIQTLSTLNVFPNPTKGELNVEMIFDQTEKVTIDLVDMAGRIVFSKELESSVDHKTLLDMRALPDGIYLMKIKAGKGFVTRKIMLVK